MGYLAQTATWLRLWGLGNLYQDHLIGARVEQRPWDVLRALRANKRPIPPQIKAVDEC